MDPATVAAIAGLVGAFIGAAAGVAVSIVNNKSQLQQLQAQWSHEEKKAQIESEAAKERETKERLQDIYANAMRNLSEVLIFTSQELYKTGYAHQTPFLEKVGEAQKWLSLVVIYYYGDREGTDFKNFYTSYITYSPSDSGFPSSGEYLRRCVIEFAKNDPRLK